MEYYDIIGQNNETQSTTFDDPVAFNPFRYDGICVHKQISTSM